MDRIQELRNSLPRRERRLITGGAELRAAPDTPTKIGMKIPYGVRSADMGFTEIIDPGAFTKTLSEAGADVVSLWNHDPAWVLGRQSNRSLAITSGKDGLDAEVTLDPKNDMHMGCFAPSVARGDVKGSSFGFETVRDNWEYGPDPDDVVRTLLEVRLLDVSPVTFPAYPDSEAESRAMREERATVLAAVRGVDLVELRSIIAAVEEGHALPKHAPSLRRMIGVLTGMLPAAVMPLSVRRLRLGLRERALGFRAKTTETSWSKPALSDFTDKGWDELTAKERGAIADCFAWAPPDAKSFSDLKLPYKHPDGTVNLNAVNNALARLDQTAGPSDAQKDAIRTKLEQIVANAKSDQAA